MKIIISGILQVLLQVLILADKIKAHHGRARNFTEFKPLYETTLKWHSFFSDLLGVTGGVA
jgi:hypothetical protein